ncbi:MAG: DUF1963 domain-containing protein [Sphingomonas bacterium]
MAGPNIFLRLLAQVTKGSSDKNEPDPDADEEAARRFDARVARVRGAHSIEESNISAGAPVDDGAVPSADPVDEYSSVSIPPQAPALVSETISVVLRRQIPVRFDEAPASWLGGLPMMPDEVEWPRGVNSEKPEEGARPLHFVAQIACADLPPELWGGLGPRQGWLLFFLNSNASTLDDGKLHQVLHTMTLGDERDPPDDIGPVHDGVYTGSQFTQYLDQADVPSLWRRWPVDLVAFPNQLYRDGQCSSGTPPDFSGILYPAQQIGKERHAPDVEPFSWRCLCYGWQGLASVGPVRTPRETGEEQLHDKLEALGPPEMILEGWDAREREFDETEAGRMLGVDPDTVADNQREWLEGVRQNKVARELSRARLAALIATHPTHEALRTFLLAEKDRRDAWRASAAERHAALGAAIAQTNPDTRLDPEQWQAIRAELDDDRLTTWRAWHSRDSVTLEEQSETAWAPFSYRALPASLHAAADCYVDPARRHLVPDEALAELEPWWRTLYSNRPHRIGGYHDGVQSDAKEGPTGELLLLQLATDDPMQWCWGDAGAVYWVLPIAALASGAFDSAECYLECH